MKLFLLNEQKHLIVSFLFSLEKKSLINDVGNSNAHWAAKTLKPLLGKENNSDFFFVFSVEDILSSYCS